MDNLEKAVAVLKKGGIAIFPTDTAYGIGCRIDDEEAVKRLFALRKRPISQAVPVLVDSIEMAQKYLASPLPNNVRLLMQRYWPGALTVVYYCLTSKVPSLVRGGSNTLGVRMPNNKLILSMISKIGVPILGPSANFHGKPTPFKYEELDKELVSLVDYVFKGECLNKEVSTVINCVAKPWKMIRQGAAKVDR